MPFWGASAIRFTFLINRSDYIQVGWLSYDVTTILKALDATTWDIAKSEFLDNQVSDEILFTVDNGSTYYLTSDVEELVEGEED